MAKRMSANIVPKIRYLKKSMSSIPIATQKMANAIIRHMSCCSYILCFYYMHPGTNDVKKTLYSLFSSSGNAASTASSSLIISCFGAVNLSTMSGIISRIFVTPS